MYSQNLTKSGAEIFREYMYLKYPAGQMYPVPPAAIAYTSIPAQRYSPISIWSWERTKRAMLPFK